MNSKQFPKDCSYVLNNLKIAAFAELKDCGHVIVTRIPDVVGCLLINTSDEDNALPDEFEGMLTNYFYVLNYGASFE